MQSVADVREVFGGDSRGSASAGIEGMSLDPVRGCRKSMARSWPRHEIYQVDHTVATFFSFMHVFDLVVR